MYLFQGCSQEFVKRGTEFIFSCQGGLKTNDFTGAPPPHLNEESPEITLTVEE